MIRVYIIGALVAALVAAGGWLYWHGGKNAREDTMRAVERSETLERINDATTDNRDAGDIDERLRDLAK